jgi:hypothetical protein
MKSLQLLISRFYVPARGGVRHATIATRTSVYNICRSAEEDELDVCDHQEAFHYRYPVLAYDVDPSLQKGLLDGCYIEGIMELRKSTSVCYKMIVEHLIAVSVLFSQFKNTHNMPLV